MLRILAFDPGGTTGVAAVNYPAIGEAPDRWKVQQIKGEETKQASLMAKLVDQLLRDQAKNPGLRIAVVSERFIIRKFNQSRDFLAPVRLNSCLEWHCAEMAVEPVEIHWQQPSLAKSAWTDARLKAGGYWLTASKGGGDHAMDALRHALTFGRRVVESPALRRSVGL